MIGHIGSEGPIHNILIWLRVRCYRSNVSTLAQHSMKNSDMFLCWCQHIIVSPKIGGPILCSLFTSGRDAISKNAEQFSFRNVGDDSRSNISFRASLG